MWRTPRHRRGRRLAARHPHRGHRPQLSRADHRLEIQISPGCRVPRRGPHRDDRLQDPAAALGQRTHPDLQKDSAPRLPLRRPAPRQDRGLVPPHRQHQLPAHDGAFRPADAGHDHPLLPGLVEMLFIDFPLFLASTFSISSSTSFPRKNSSRGAGTAPSSTCRSSWRSASGSPSPTPSPSWKRSSASRAPSSARPNTASRRGARNRRRLQISQEARHHSLYRAPHRRLFRCRIWYAVANENYFTVPFLLLFVIGYLYTGLLSLFQGRFERWRSGANLDDTSPKPFPVGV